MYGGNYTPSCAVNLITTISGELNSLKPGRAYADDAPRPVVVYMYTELERRSPETCAPSGSQPPRGSRSSGTNSAPTNGSRHCPPT